MALTLTRFFGPLVLGSSLALPGAAAISLACVSAASAQVATVEPFWAAVTGSGTILRCGENDKYYAIGALASGQVLRVDGEGSGWSRVALPTGYSAFVPADAATVDLSARTATLIKATRPRAVKADATRALGSWKPLTDEPLPAGSTLTLADTTQLDDGNGKFAYRVVAPEGSHAYVPSGALQRAMQDQVDAHLATLPKPVAPAPEPPTTTTNLTDPLVPKAVDPEPKAVVEAPIREPTLAEKLEASFDAVRRQPMADAEFSELIAEYGKAIAELDDTPFSQRIKSRLQLRLDLLRISADYQTQLRAITESQPKIDESLAREAERLAELNRVRQYDVVGRLSASTIYDGTRMPLMYRVQSVGGPLPRTLAYVKPDPAMKIGAKLGEIVGIVGTTGLDPTLRLNIIVPTRVDLLTAEIAAPATPPGGG